MESGPEILALVFLMSSFVSSISCIYFLYITVVNHDKPSCTQPSQREKYGFDLHARGRSNLLRIRLIKPSLGMGRAQKSLPSTDHCEHAELLQDFVLYLI